MKPFRVSLWACALGLLGIEAGSAQAAWNNVFQVCCHSCRSQVSASYYAGNGCCQPCCPPTVCTTQYVQRCYYTPVTCYHSQTYYEPVTTYRTSYYYEPVTSYRYSCYYDPCTCCYQQVACPTTCYRLRSQCCAVTSYLQRTCTVPVTTYRQSCYLQPVTCCTPACPPPCCPTPCGNGHAQPAPNGEAAPSVTEQVTPGPSQAPPSATEQRLPPQPGVLEQRNGQSYERQYPVPADPNTPPASRRGRAAKPAPARSVTPPPIVRLDKIVSLPALGASVSGQVVSNANVPQGNAKLLFVHADKRGSRQSVQADRAGRFDVTLGSGKWLVYMNGSDGRPVFHSKIDIKDRETRRIVLVSR